MCPSDSRCPVSGQRREMQQKDIGRLHAMWIETGRWGYIHSPKQMH
jgi:hypothetical protein